MSGPGSLAPLRLDGAAKPTLSWSRPEEEDPDMMPPTDLTEKFEIHWSSTIGEGAFSTVRECTEISTGEKFAIKIIDMRPLKIRRSFALTRVLREVTIMKSLEHENIVKLKAMYHTKAVLWLVQELANGGELFQAIARLGAFPEVLARSVIRQVMSAIKYLHDRGTVHRDIKPENIMLSFKGKSRPVPGMSLVDVNPIVKLVDFGLAKMLGEEHSAAKTMLGTPQYIAPEVLLAAHDHSRSYGFPVDCWSVGVVLYLVLAGRFPFEGPTGESQTDSMMDVDDFTEFRILHGSFEFDSAEWAHISNAAKHLVCGLLTVDPGSRLTMEQSLSHPWITGVGSEGLPSIPDKPTFNEEYIARSASYASLYGTSAGGGAVSTGGSTGMSRSGSQSDFRSGSAAGGGPVAGLSSNTGATLSLLPPLTTQDSSSSLGGGGAHTPTSSTSSLGSALHSTAPELGSPTPAPIFHASSLPASHFPPYTPIGLTHHHSTGQMFHQSAEAGFAGLSSGGSARGWPTFPPPLSDPEPYRGSASCPAQPPTLPSFVSPPHIPPSIPSHHSFHAHHVPVGPSPAYGFSEPRPASLSVPILPRSNSVHTEESGDRSVTFLLSYATDARGIITSVSDQLADVLGYSKGALIGQPAVRIVSSVSADVFRMLEVTGSCLNTPVTMVHATGRTLELLMSAKSARSAKGAITGFTMSLSQMEDVSDEPMINVLDARGVFVSASESWLEWLGLSDEEVLGRRMTEFLTASCRDNFSSVLLPAVRVTGSSSSVILLFVAKSGAILPAWVDIVATRRRGVVHRLEVTVTPHVGDVPPFEALAGDDDDGMVAPMDVGGGSEGSLETVPSVVSFDGPGMRAAGGGPPPNLMLPPPRPLDLTRTMSEMSVVDEDDEVSEAVHIHDF